MSANSIEASPTNAPLNANPAKEVESEYAHQAEKLSLAAKDQHGSPSGTAMRADFITPQDPVIVTRDGGRLPTVPLEEAEKLNKLREGSEGRPGNTIDESLPHKKSKENVSPDLKNDGKTQEQSLQKSTQNPQTHPLFPPLPLYGPPSIMRDVHCLVFRATSFVLSFSFLGVIVVCAVGSAVPRIARYAWLRITSRNPDTTRPFYEEETRNKKMRREEDRSWKKAKRRTSKVGLDDDNENEAVYGEFVPTEGGTDPIVCDVGYYARRVGLDMEEYRVQTEDGFIIKLWHIYNPLEYTPLPEEERGERGPEAFASNINPSRERKSKHKPKYPILMLHGLLQSAGAYCVLDDNSLAFYLCKSGYDVWLGNNRCGFEPEHTKLSYSDPRMWSWNIRQMGVLDLPALTSRVLSETGFPRLGLVGHSQGTTQAFVAFAKEQRPDLGDKISVFCALAPAAYSGPLLDKFYFKFMRMLSPSVFRVCFGLHAFIPFMMLMQKWLPSRPYGTMGYHVFTYLFNWSDTRWDRGLRDRCFKFAPVYISAESMRWWLGRDCFARHTCILATREECDVEEAEDVHVVSKNNEESEDRRPPPLERNKNNGKKQKGSEPWYDERSPPMAFWIPGSDQLVDGRRLLNRFERGREPHARLLYNKIIEEYEHLDVIWAMDNIEKVGSEVKEVLWKTCSVRDTVRTPKGCEAVDAWIDPRSNRF